MIWGAPEGSRVAGKRPSSYHADVRLKHEVIYKAKGVTADLLLVVEPPKQETIVPIEPPAPEPQPPKEEPKPELKEVSIQMDEWAPPFLQRLLHIVHRARRVKSSSAANKKHDAPSLLVLTCGGLIAPKGGNRLK
ncbi:hypothetical protein HGRIS_004282 [Hohenbuehelia grisea]|uniref:Uncharacterized protein n=1 Tax=Hohenbuehelia grisea TaxID=104357 RepID=A0ABR3IPC7_9AGAR